MSTAATSTIQNIKSRLPTSNSIHTITINGNEGKSNGIYNKKPMSATNLLQNYSSTNNFNRHPNQRKNYPTKPIAIDNKKQQNGHSSKTKMPSPPIVFHAIAPAPKSNELDHSVKQDIYEQKVLGFFSFFYIISNQSSNVNEKKRREVLFYSLHISYV